MADKSSDFPYYCEIDCLPTKDIVIYSFGWLAIIFLSFVVTFHLGLALFKLYGNFWYLSCLSYFAQKLWAFPALHFKLKRQFSWFFTECLSESCERRRQQRRRAAPPPPPPAAAPPAPIMHNASESSRSLPDLCYPHGSTTSYGACGHPSGV